MVVCNYVCLFVYACEMEDGRIGSCVVFVCCDGEKVTHKMKFCKANRVYIQIVTQIKTSF